MNPAHTAGRIQPTVRRQASRTSSVSTVPAITSPAVGAKARRMKSSKTTSGYAHTARDSAARAQSRIEGVSLPLRLGL
jgi:hypothetical protein